MGWFNPAKWLSARARTLFEGMVSACSSEASAVADCLNTIAENAEDADDTMAHDASLADNADELVDWAKSAAQGLRDDQSCAVTQTLYDGTNPAAKLEARVQLRPNGIEVFLAGYGTNDMEPGAGPVLFVEFYEGVPKLHVWADITTDGMTDSIDLSRASEAFRKD